MRPPRVLVLVLLILPLASLGSPGAAAITLTQFENQTTFGASAYLVYLGQRMAQSFTASTNYTIARVTLYCYDRGTDDVMGVSLVRDVTGLPGTGPSDTLAQAFNNTPSTANWYDFDLSSPVPLVAGTRYWIVANNSALNGNNGYAWYFASADVYAGGYPAFDQGTGWATTTGDMAFRNYGYLDAVVKVGLRGQPSLAPVGSTVQYRVWLNNSGAIAAPRVWANMTLPANLTYGSDSAGTLGGSLQGPTRWLFLNLTPGAHSFLVNTTLVGGLGGTIVTTAVTARYVGALGTVVDGGSGSSSLTVQGPNLVPTLGLSPNPLRRGNNLSLQGYFNNTGNYITGSAWLNFTLPTAMAYVGDNVASTATVLGRSSGPGFLRITLTNVAVGSHPYTVWLTPVGDPPVGTTFPASLAVEFRDPAGTRYPRVTVAAQTVLVGPRLTLALAQNRTFVTPGDHVMAHLDYANGGASATAATQVFITLALDPNLAPLNFSGAGAWDNLNHSIIWSLGTVGVGQAGTLWVNTSAPWPLADMVILVQGARADLRDDVGDPMPVVYANATLPVRAPVLSLVTGLSRSTLEVVDNLVYTVAFNNTGTGATGTATVDATLGPGLAFQGFLLQGTAGNLVGFQTTGDTLHFTMQGLAPGPHALVLQLAPAGRLLDGTRLTVSSGLAYGDLNGNPGLAMVGPVLGATVRAPSLVASLSISTTSALPGQRVQLGVSIQNIGDALAHDYWANLTLDPSLQAVGGTAPVAPDVLGPRYSYHLSDLAPGATLAFDLDLEVVANATAGRSMYFIMVVEYGDAKGVHLESIRPQGVALTVLAGPIAGFNPMALAFPLALVAAVAIALGLAIRYLREPEIEEVLLVHKEGLLMAQASRTTEVRGKDRDILASSLVAVKDFIREAFVEEADKDLDRMDLGDYKILIRRGRGAFLVVALEGSPTGRTIARVRDAIQAIEGALGSRLEDWNGDTEEVEVVRPILEGLVHRGRDAPRAGHHPAPRAPPRYPSQ